MEKVAGFEDVIDNLGSTISAAPDRLKDFWDGLSDDTKDTIQNALIGSAVGGGLGLGLAPSDGDTSPWSAALKGALMGGLAGGAGTMGYKMLNGSVKLPSEEPHRNTSILGALNDNLVNGISSMVGGHPLTTAGVIGGGIGASKALPRVSNLAEQAANIAQRVENSTGGNGNGSAIMQSLEDLLRGRATSGASLDSAITGSAARDITNLTTRPVEVVESIESVLPRILNPNLARKMRANNYIRELGGMAHNPMWLAALPAGAYLGYLADRYARGDNG